MEYADPICFKLANETRALMKRINETSIGERFTMADKRRLQMASRLFDDASRILLEIREKS